MNERDTKEFLDDFTKADISKKLDMWFYALDQEALWEEIMEEMSKIARINLMKSSVNPTIVEE